MSSLQLNRMRETKYVQNQAAERMRGLSLSPLQEELREVLEHLTLVGKSALLAQHDKVRLFFPSCFLLGSPLRSPFFWQMHLCRIQEGPDELNAALTSPDGFSLRSASGGSRQPQHGNASPDQTLLLEAAHQAANDIHAHKIRVDTTNGVRKIYCNCTVVRPLLIFIFVFVNVT